MRSKSLLASGVLTRERRKPTQAQPFRKCRTQRSRTNDANVICLDLRAQIAKAAPGLDEESQIRFDLQIDLKTRILQTHIDDTVFVNEPEATAIRWHAREFEFECGSTGRHRRRVEAHVHAPHKKRRIEIIARHVSRPLLTPDRELVDDPLERATGRRERIGANNPFLCGAAYDQTTVFEMIESPSEQ